MPLTLTFPAKVLAPGQKLPWSTPGAPVPAQETDDTISIYLDDDNLNNLKAALSGQATADYSPAGIAANTTEADIEAALKLRIQSGKG